MDLIRQFEPEQCASALSSWGWLDDGLASLVATYATAFGDVFLRDGAGGFWFLDSLEGSLTRLWDSGAELQAALNTAEGQDQFLMAGLVQRAAEVGLVPGAGQVLTFKVPPVLGGPVDIDNVEVGDFVVALGLAGQIHQQVKDLPSGTSITDVSIG
jgi:hypothetical protein